MERNLIVREVVDGVISCLKEKGCIKEETNIDIYRCTESYNDGLESGTAGIDFNRLLVMQVPGSKRVFVILLGKGTTRSRGETDIMFELRKFDVTDIFSVCEEWELGREGFVNIVTEVMKRKLSVGAAFFVVMDWHFPIDAGVMMRVDMKGNIFLGNRNLERFRDKGSKTNWLPELPGYIAESIVNGILDSESR